MSSFESERASSGIARPLRAETVSKTKRPDTAPAMAGRRIEWATCLPIPECYLRWFETSFVISNIDTCRLPPNTALNFSSALIRRLLIESCSLFLLM